ncbi:hypothetical protein DR64_760 [Paraburkholderia xenovorans LB400]|uniref:Uncharacterized protein n=1 Tax=Paraburkholderia xenovorans (strain LB400) TaxID=266265 RepID=Q141T8_PARXL|nr:hypothetical protein [Paraburkholderia xenovorans]ABE29901.1 hypothetical protein Bxe_A3078 [Paraburkholderia xenovorans LB400]AIP32696.1 hypothetical protein DR64_760 [Paraburkholderia xenovorans LB400]
MSELLILSVIAAPLVLVPAFIVSFLSYVEPLSWPYTEIAFAIAEESEFARFEREMLEKIAASLAIPKELLDEPYESSGYSYFAESLKRDAQRYGGWR